LRGPQAAAALARTAAYAAAETGFDDRVPRIAHRALGKAKSQPEIDAICAAWHSSGDPALGELIGRHRWVASGPPAVRARTALRGGHAGLLAAADPELARALAVQAPPERAMALLGTLARAGWSPPAESDRGRFARLATLAGKCPGAMPTAGVFGRRREVSLPGSAGEIWTSAFPFALSTDGTLAAMAYTAESVAAPGHVVVWRVPSGEEVVRLKITDQISSLALGPAALAVFRNTSRVRPPQLYQLPSGRRIPVGGRPAAYTAAFSPDGKLVMFDDLHSGRVEIRRLPGGDLTGMVAPDPPGQISSFAVTPDGSMLLGCSSRGAVWRWQMPAGAASPCGTAPCTCWPGRRPARSIRRSCCAARSPRDRAPAAAWLDFTEALAGWNYRHDIELGTTTGQEPEATDISLR
jgi:hypothetical protein